MANRVVSIKSLRPNNWFLNKEKVEAIRLIWRKGQQDFLPPVLASEIDGQLALIDGNTRAFVAWERKQKLISIVLKDIKDIGNHGNLYKTLHRKGPEVGILSVCDLIERILEPQDYQRKWIKFCEDMLTKIQ